VRARTTIPFLGLLFATAIAAAAPLKLGPEIPVGDATFGNAALSQAAASVASNGRDYLVVWNDARSQPNGARRPALYAGRVDANGNLVEPAGHKLVDNAEGQLVWTGSSYVLVYDVLGISFEQFLDDNGYPTGPPIHLFLGGPSLAVGTNGHNIVAVNSIGDAYLVGFDGSASRQIIGHQIVDVSQIMTTPAGDYVFAADEADCPAAPCAQHIVLERVDGTTGEVTRNPLMDVSYGTQLSGVATDDGRLLIVWSDPKNDELSARYEIVDAAGKVLAGPSLLFNTTPFHGISTGWDGREFLVAFAQQSWRLSANGQVVEHGPADPAPLLFAHSASGVLEARTAANGIDSDALVRAAPSFAQLAAAPEHSVAMSSRQQQQPRLAESPVGFAAWFENNASLMVQPIGGAVTHIADANAPDAYFPPALGVARGGSGYLVVWQADGFRAKRLALDGTPLDAEPIPFATADEFQFEVAGKISIAFDGTNFLVVWPALLGGVHGVRISQSGTVLDATPLVIAPRNDHDAARARVVWNGKNYVVAWLDVLSCRCGISPAPPPQVRVFATRLDRDGRPLDAQPAVLSDQTSVITSLALATNGDGAALEWTGAGCVTAAALRADGTPAGEPRALACRTPQPANDENWFTDAGVAWSGSEYIAVWHDPVAQVIHAARLDETLAPIDDFDVSPAGLGASQPDIAATASGVAIAYVRFAPEAQFGGAPRIFVRLLERLRTLPRHRAAR